MLKKIYLFATLTAFINSNQILAQTCEQIYNGKPFLEVHILRPAVDVKEAEVICKYLSDESRNRDNPALHRYTLTGNYNPVSGNWLNLYPRYICGNRFDHDAKKCVFEKIETLLRDETKR